MCVQLVTFPSFAHQPSLKKFTEKRCEIRKRNFLSSYYVQWEPVQKRTQAEIRPAHERIRGDEFHSILENDDTLNLGQVWKENVVSSEAVLRLKKKEQMLQIQ